MQVEPFKSLQQKSGSSLAKYSAHDWLVINPELTDKKLVASMICKLCRQFEDRITSVKRRRHALRQGKVNKYVNPRNNLSLLAGTPYDSVVHNKIWRLGCDEKINEYRLVRMSFYWLAKRSTCNKNNVAIIK